MALQAELAGSRTQTKDFEWSPLVKSDEGPHVSVYAGLDSRSLRSELAELVQRVRQSGEQNASATAEALEGVVKQLAEEPATRKPQMGEMKTQGSLVVFASPQFSAVYRMPVTFPAKTVVGDAFFIRPLLAELHPESRFYVLAFSQKRVRLIECRQFSFREVELQDIPELIGEDLEREAFESQRQFHSAAPATEGKKGSVFYGGETDRKTRIAHFFRDLNEHVSKALHGREAPIVLAGVERLISIYKAVNPGAHLLPESIEGNPDRLAPSALHDAGLKILEKYWAVQREKAFAEYHDQANTPLTSTNLRKILTDAERGHIRWLFLTPAGEQWGKLSADTAHLHAQKEPGDEDLPNLAAVLTLRTGGMVHVVSLERLPEGAEAAAVFRF
jgi:hypothetical protein